MLELLLPFVKKEDILLSQKGDDLIVKVGDYKRTSFCFGARDAIGAKLEEGLLKIRFGGVKNGRQ